ncbi:DUF2065 domain-containing protein [Tianweitania sediminis]|uniref:DUF2065 family protein n=1 Tax=Tianweitania sediminis TaxID=1502156 RepID=A0A8J7QZU4_9HYPH|nr:DUF2065 family protein [Tianweitania sediminis]MBP0439160.1 DUF2065 family protein [Tianweitania sediminis]HEV7414516.1 DUF2065 family protein [Tianweitania sediminis]
MNDFLDAIGLVLVIEGLIYCGFPNFARRLAEEVRTTADTTLRISGLVAMLAGVVLVWVVRG